MKLCQYLQSNLCSNILGTILQLGSNVPYSHSTHKHWLAVWRLTSRTRRAINTRRYVIAQTGDTGWPRKCRVRLCKLLHREHGDLGIQLFNSSKSSHQNSKRDAHMEKELLCSALCSIKGPTSRKWMSSSSFPLIFFWSKLHGFLFLLAFTHLGANGTPSSSRQLMYTWCFGSTAWNLDIRRRSTKAKSCKRRGHPARPGKWGAWFAPLIEGRHLVCSRILQLGTAMGVQRCQGSIPAVLSLVFELHGGSCSTATTSIAALQHCSMQCTSSLHGGRLIFLLWVFSEVIAEAFLFICKCDRLLLKLGYPQGRMSRH